MSAPLCVACAHYQPPPAGMAPALHATCLRYRQPPSLVDGSQGAPRLCDAVRDTPSACGRHGAGFEPAKVAA